MGKESLKQPQQVSSSTTTDPPPPPPLPESWAMASKACHDQGVKWSVTKREIEKYWRKKKMEEEDHLFAAIKAAARIRARKLTEQDYREFEESLKEEKMKNHEDILMAARYDDLDENSKEIRVGIKDWWTKSRYAYLNQPATAETIKKDRPRRASNYTPNTCLYNYKPPSYYYTNAFLGVY